MKKTIHQKLIAYLAVFGFFLFMFLLTLAARGTENYNSILWKIYPLTSFLTGSGFEFTIAIYLVLGLIFTLVKITPKTFFVTIFCYAILENVASFISIGIQWQLASCRTEPGGCEMGGLLVILPLVEFILTLVFFGLIQLVRVFVRIVRKDFFKIS